MSAAAAVVNAALAGRGPARAYDEACAHVLGDPFPKRSTMLNGLSAAHLRGDLTGPVIVLLEHVAPGTARQLLPYYHLLARHSRGWSLSEVVERVNATVRHCPGCAAQRRRRRRGAFQLLRAEEFADAVGTTQRGRRPRRAPSDSVWAPRESAGRRVTLVTGVSGMARDRALAKLAARPGRPRTVVDVDQHFCALTDHLLERFEIEPVWPEQPSLQRAFLLNAQVLQECWRLAFRSALTGDVGIPEVAPALRGLTTVRRALADGDVLLSCHLTWYDVQAHGFLVGADLPELRRLTGQPFATRVVAFVDDIFDVCARLIATGMYAHLDDDREAPLLEDLLRIVEWRRLEALTSETVARALGTDCVIVPMKLPITTVDKLIDGDRADIVYLSYSVGHPFESDDPQEGKPWREHVIAVARRLGATESLAVVEASAVDEFRIRADASVRERWIVGDEPLLAVDLDDCDERAFVDDPYVGRDDPLIQRLTLRAQLLDLVHARGRALARQAGVIVLLRPFAAPGRLAEGMDIVSEQNHRLVEYADAFPSGLAGTPPPPHVPAVVFHTRDDEWHRRTSVLAEGWHDALTRFGRGALTDPQRAAFARALAESADSFDAWAAAGPRTVGRHVTRIYQEVQGASSAGRLSGTQASFDRAVWETLRDAVDVRRHRRAKGSTAPGTLVEAFGNAVFVVARSWRDVDAETLAAALAEGVARARRREVGAVDAATLAWRPLAEAPAIDWSALG